jgi:hypothetical protein
MLWGPNIETEKRILQDFNLWSCPEGAKETQNKIANTSLGSHSRQLE